MKIVIADNMEPEVVEGIRKLGTVVYKPADLKAELNDAEALIVRSATKVTADLIANAGKLKIVARAGVGLDNVDVKACEAKGIKVINTPGASSNAVAELVIGTMISMLRNFQKAHCQMKNKVWDKKNLIGNEIAGKTLGVIGFGRIGAMAAEKAHALGMKIIAYDPHAKAVPYAKFVSLEELFANSDVITLHTVLVPETKGMINRENIAKMKNGVWIVNAARGELIDEDSIYEACKSGKVAGAALDVYWQEPYSGKLLELDNVCFTPHLGASTKEAQVRIGVELVEKLSVELK
ncbi:MAG: hydroxyacid dehydrogenase [Candidatus Micrarchaeia archaeon]